jgi:hypothetical protein
LNLDEMLVVIRLRQRGMQVAKPRLAW